MADGRRCDSASRSRDGPPLCASCNVRVSEGDAMSGSTDEQLDFLGDLEEFAEYEGRPVDDRCLELVNHIRHEFVVMKRSMATMQDVDPVLNTDGLYGFWPIG